MNNKEIILPKKGRLLVVTDLHGNQEDYEKYIELWNRDDENNHIVFVGDLIHATSSNDKSVEILDDVIEKTEKYDNFHVLLGNHEWSHITGTNVYKNKINQREKFEKDIIAKKKSLQPTLDEYVKFFKSLPYFIKTDNGLFISHAGPSTRINSISDYEKIFDDDYDNILLNDFLWNRPYTNYNDEDVDNFLDVIDKKCMIVGHTNVHGFAKISRQIVITSSFQTDNKVYFDIDLERQIDDMDDLMEYLKFLD